MSKSLEKKKEQLGMHPSTASGKLLRDIIFESVVIKNKHTCYLCGGELTRDTFSIEHKDPWLDSDDPSANFFDLDNIAYSHLSCNAGASRQPKRKCMSKDERRIRDNELAKIRYAKLPKEERQRIRRTQYLRTGT